MPQSDLSRVTEERAKSKGGFDDIADVETNVKPRGGDRLLRFKIANKNKAAAKLPILPPQQSSTGSRSSLQNVNPEQFRRSPPGL